MTEHLPECPVAAARPGTFTSCICDRLRACEERVLGERDELVGVTAFRAFRAGLAAAREAVAALVTERELRSPSGLDIDIHEALSAIDALGKKDE